MRNRSTWQQKKSDETTPRQAATQRKADIYTMNQERTQPGVTDYESGSPESWGEGVVTGDKMSVNDEYEGGHVKRNEVGFPEFRDDTWKHKDADKWNDGKKYDNSKLAAERRAMAATRVARALLRTDNESLVEQAALDLMALPAKALVATLKRLDQVSPDALSEQAKLKRAYACTKLAANVLGDSAKDEHVETLASHFMSIDDPTLKAILKTVAAGRVAQQDEGDEGKGPDVAAQSQEQDAPAADTAATEQTALGEETAMDDQTGLSGDEMALLDSMLQADGCPAPAPVPGAAPGLAPAVPAAPVGDSLTDLFEAAPAPAPVAPVMAANKQAGLDISFDDEGDEAVEEAHIASLDDLFADDSEVMAQRQIAQANAEAMGFSRKASANGAKKLGNVKAAPKAASKDELDAVWERP